MSIGRVSIQLPHLEEVPPWDPWEGAFSTEAAVVPDEREPPAWVTAVATDARRPEALTLNAEERAKNMRAAERVPGRRLRDDAYDLVGMLVDRMVLAPFTMVVSNLRMILVAVALLLALGVAADHLLDLMLAPFGR